MATTSTHALTHTFFYYVGEDDCLILYKLFFLSLLKVKYVDYLKTLIDYTCYFVDNWFNYDILFLT